jgi:hypothetical protein
MDAFLSDVLDLTPGAPPPPELFVDGQLRIDRILTNPVLHATLAFHDAWQAAFGTTPSRVDFWDFRARSGAQALADCLLECTPLRAMPRAQEMMNRATEAYQKGAAAAAASLDAASAKLVRKLADRVCCGSDPALAAATVARDEPNLVAMYAALCTRHSGLLEFEAWARAAQGGEGVPAAPPTTVAEFYERSADAIRALDMLSVSPLTGVTLAALPTKAPFLTCTEAMRLAVMRDGYLWRRDAGGALVCIPPPPSSASPHPASASWPATLKKSFRTVHAPWSALLAILPSGMYARILAVVDRQMWRSLQTTTSVASDIVHVVVSDGGGGESPPQDERDRAVSGRVAWVSNAFQAEAVLTAARRTWIPTPASFSSAAWAEPMNLAMLKTLVLLPESDGTIMFQQFVARYAETRRLGSRVFSVPARGELGEIVILDSRPNVWSVLSVLLTLDNVADGKWSVRVLTGTGNRAFMERCLLPHAPGARIEVIDELLDEDASSTTAFDIERYNTVLKSSRFWERIDAPRALIVQDDGMLVRPGIEERFMDYDYVGAPWADVPANAALKRDVPTLVGNGGMSLRNVAAMRSIAASHEKEGRRLFNHRLQPVPEDVFFASAVSKSCPTEVAQGFAFEECAPPPPGRPTPVGFHKPWGYLPRDTVLAFFSAAIKDAELRPT